MGETTNGGARRRQRPFDVKPTIYSLVFSLALTIGLIIGTSDTVESLSAGSAVFATEAELVNARSVVSPGADRQLVAPSLTPLDAASLTEAITAQAVAIDPVDEPSVNSPSANDVTRTDTDDSDDFDEPVVSSENDEPVAEVAGEVLDAEDVDDDQEIPVTSSSVVIFVPVTTAPFEVVVQPTAATTTQVPRVVTTTSVVTPVTRPVPESSVVSSTVPVTTTTSTTTSTTTTTTVAPAPVLVRGSYTITQVIDGTVGAGDGSNPNEESPMGAHDAPLYLPQGWSWSQGSTRNPQWGNLGSNQFTEFRCAVIPENGHVPPVDFRVNFREGAYYQFASGSWSKAFDVALDSPTNGAYLGTAGQVNRDPFASGKGSIDWRLEADGSYSAPWNSAALMMHFWAGERQSPAAGQTAEFLTSEMRLQQPDGQTVDLDRVQVLFQCGIDYYNTTGGQGTQVPGPGIGKYHALTPDWDAGLWVTLPNGVPANNTSEFRSWLEANPPPNVR